MMENLTAYMPSTGPEIVSVALIVIIVSAVVVVQFVYPFAKEHLFW